MIGEWNGYDEFVRLRLGEVIGKTGDGMFVMFNGEGVEELNGRGFGGGKRVGGRGFIGGGWDVLDEVGGERL